MGLIEGKVYIYNTYKNPHDFILVFEVVNIDNGNNINNLINDGYLSIYEPAEIANDYYICKVIYCNSKYGYYPCDHFLIDEDNTVDVNFCIDYSKVLIELQIDRFIEES